MARKIPVIIWIIRHNPSREPKFHHMESLLGEGRSMSDPLIIRNNGCLFRIGPVIYINGILLISPFIAFGKNFGLL